MTSNWGMVAINWRLTPVLPQLPPSQALMHRTLLWTFSVVLQRPLDTSHTRTNPSHPAVAACIPSGLKQTLQIASVSPYTHRT